MATSTDDLARFLTPLFNGTILNCVNGACACLRWPANDCVIAHLRVARLTMSEDDGSTTFREDDAAVGTGGGMRAAGHACGLSAGSLYRPGQGDNAGYGTCSGRSERKFRTGAI